MKKRVHTILCWILAISLVWLPLSVSADILQSSISKERCHEMNSSMSGHDMSDHSRHSAINNQTATLDNSMHKAMKQKGCCDQCDGSCNGCVGMTSCGHSPNHVSAFILFDQHSSQSIPLIQFSIEQSVQYHNQIITPDFRPPIV